MRHSVNIFYLWPICLLFFLAEAQGQPTFNPDSLKAVLGSDLAQDMKDKAVQELAEGFLPYDLSQAAFYCEELIKRGRRDEKKYLLTEGYRIKGGIFLQKENYDSSLFYCDEALRVASSQKDLSRQAEINITKGTALSLSAGPKEGARAYQESYRLFESIGDSLGLAKALNGLASMYMLTNHYDSALTYYIEMVKLAEKKGYRELLGRGYLNMGILYQYQQDEELAVKYLDLSIPFHEKTRPDLVAVAHMNLGLVFYDRAVYDSALTEFRFALREYLSLDNQKRIADVYNNLGNLYSDLLDHDSASFYYLKAKSIYEEQGSLYTLAQVYNNLALESYYTRDYKTALNLLDSTYELAVKTGHKSLEAKVYYIRYLIFSENGRYKEALENYLVYDSIDNEIYTLEKDKAMAEVQMKYQDEQKTAQLLAQENQLLILSKKNNIYLFTGIGIIALVTFILLYFRQRAVKDRIIAEQRVRQLEEEKKLLAARSLVEGQEEERKRIARELHDGLGVLLSTTRIQFSAIGDTSPEARPLIERATQLLEQASSDVRKISHNMMPGLLTKLGLFEAVGDLFDKLSETEGLNVVAQIPEEAGRMPENKEIMLYRIIQELVNNTLKHSGAKNIQLIMEMNQGRLDITYTDDGKGFDMEEKLQSKSIGLTSLQSRVNFLNGKMQMHSEQGKGVYYTLEIPFERIQKHEIH